MSAPDPSRDPLADLSADLVSRLAAVRLAVFDVDGTLTDGRVIYVGDEEQQSFCVHDGQGLAWLGRAGVELAWITGRGCRATIKRAEELGVRHLHMREGPKNVVLQALQVEAGIAVEATLAMGDDLPDLAMVPQAAIFVAPANARPEVLHAADYVTSAAAGAGAAREVAELVLRARGDWESLTRGQV
ncbi:MAG: 3-deoxy-D-manno-octulosonate 8-phosphate phosphatase (KDO 8-P phosphatase) [Planctomycetota bacterium]|jgi:3-deoxy-D-manno-octulosonate 8-phosphate phosphatase (KDO 8-P phosphatase)